MIDKKKPFQAIPVSLLNPQAIAMTHIAPWPEAIAVRMTRVEVGNAGRRCSSDGRGYRVPAGDRAVVSWNGWFVWT